MPRVFQDAAASCNPAIVIHQILIKYDAAADRLLLQVRTRADEVFAIWLTRRMLLRLWPPVQQLGVRVALARSHPDAVLLPDARAMLADAARQRPRPNADFTQLFNSTARTNRWGRSRCWPPRSNCRSRPRVACA